MENTVHRARTSIVIHEHIQGRSLPFAHNRRNEGRTLQSLFRTQGIFPFLVQPTTDIIPFVQMQLGVSVAVFIDKLLTLVAKLRKPLRIVCVAVEREEVKWYAMCLSVFQEFFRHTATQPANRRTTDFQGRKFPFQVFCSDFVKL